MRIPIGTIICDACSRPIDSGRSITGSILTMIYAPWNKHFDGVLLNQTPTTRPIWYETSWNYSLTAKGP